MHTTFAILISEVIGSEKPQDGISEIVVKHEVDDSEEETGEEKGESTKAVSDARTERERTSLSGKGLEEVMYTPPSQSHRTKRMHFPLHSHPSLQQMLARRENVLREKDEGSFVPVSMTNLTITYNISVKLREQVTVLASKGKDNPFSNFVSEVRYSLFCFVTVEFISIIF